VVERQLVIHLQARHQNTDIRSMMEREGDQTVDQYRRIGARSERASLRHWCRGMPTPEGERCRMVVKATLAKVYV